jgi:hypothetical protein
MNRLRVVRRRALLAGAMIALADQRSYAAFPTRTHATGDDRTAPSSAKTAATLPSLESSASAAAAFDFTKPADAPKYLQAVLNYCLEGNTANSFADVSSNTVRKWYHAPWLHTTNSGREFIHGMTKERPSRVPELGPAQTGAHDNWAVGFYNARGAFAIGQVWKDPHTRIPARPSFRRTP